MPLTCARAAVAVVGAAAALMAPTGACAQSDTTRDRVVSGGTLGAIVVTAARREQRLADAVVETAVITREDLARTGSADLAGALSRQTGVTLEGGVPAGSGVYLQGLGSQRVLVLLDGQPLTGRINGNFDLARLPTSNVERVEIVRGPQSTLYGSDALGGVINIITRRPPRRGREATVALTGGSQGRRDAALGVRGTDGTVGWALDGGFRRTDLASGIPGDAGTLARRWHVAPRAQWRPSGALTLEGSGLVVGERQRYRTGQLYNFADNVQAGGRVGATWRHGTGRFQPQLAVSRFSHFARTSTLNTPASDSGARDVQNLVQADLLWSGLAGPLLVDAGLSARREAITADRVAGHTRTLHAVEPFAQLTWMRGTLTLMPGVRATWNEQWGTSLTPRLAAMWRPAPAVALRASVGRGYRAPDFKELYLQFVNAAAGYAVVGNPDLRPETSTNVSLGVDWNTAAGFARLTMFDNRYDNFIDFGAPDAGGTYTYGNIRRGSTRGVDAEAGRTTGASRLEAGVSWLEARDAESRAPLLGRPTWSGHALASRRLGPAVHLTASVAYTGPSPLAVDTAGHITATRPDFLHVDLDASWSAGAGVEVTGGVANLLDRRLGTDWPGFTGRQWRLGVVWTGRRGVPDTR